MKKIIILSFLFLTACPNGPSPVTNEIQYCQAAENRLKALGCISSDRPYTAKDKSFTQFCQETMMSGINISPKCLSEIISCNQVNQCVQGQ